MFFLTEEFIKNIECRLDLVLYRSHFFKTIFKLKESIKNNRVSVNNKTIAYNNYLLKPGDLITINGSKLYKKNIYKKRIRNMSLLIRVNIMLPKLAYSPEHLELNLKTLSIIFLHKPYFKTLYFPTNINFFNLLRKFK